MRNSKLADKVVRTALLSVIEDTPEAIRDRLGINYPDETLETALEGLAPNAERLSSSIDAAPFKD